MAVAPFPLSAFALAERFERAHFAAAHGLAHEPPGPLASALEALAPEHPFVLNARAARALPETMLPPPPPALAPVAREVLAGDLMGALRLAQRLPLDGPTLVALGDLQLARGHVVEAEALLRGALGRLGPSAPLLCRLGRSAELRGAQEDALALTVQALVTNPLWGTARWQRRRLAEARGVLLAPLPLRVLSDEESDPWRALRQRWRREGLEEAWRWAEQLDEHNAPAFRSWALENNEALRRFFDEGLVRD